MILLWLERSTTRIHETPSAALQRGLGGFMLGVHQHIEGSPQLSQFSKLLYLYAGGLPVEVLVVVVDSLLYFFELHTLIPASRSLAISRSTQYPT